MFRASILCLFLIIAGAFPVFGDVIFLHNGRYRYGTVIGETNKTIVVRTGNRWQQIDKRDIRQVVLEKREASPAGETVTIDDERKRKGFAFGPKVGLFYPASSSLNRYHDANVLWGANLVIWARQIGLQLEYESYRDVYRNTVEMVDIMGNPAGSAVLEEELKLSPVWLSFLLRQESERYAFIGGGFGVAHAELAVSVNGGQETMHVRDSFPAMQFIVGVSGPTIGATLKYSTVFSDFYWGKVDLGGFTGTVNIYF